MTTKEKIIEAIGDIPDDKLSEVLSMIKGLKKKNKAGKGAGKWDRFFGIISNEEADAGNRGQSPFFALLSVFLRSSNRE